MSYHSRLNKAFTGALRLPLNESSKYVLISDCHRGVGNSNDNFLKNQHLYVAALQHYFKNGYTYIELGDGDELWENRDLKQIIEIHDDIFEMLAGFYKRNRLYMIYGNHDMVKKNTRYAAKSCESCHCCNNVHCYWDKQPLFPNIKFYEGIILQKNYPRSEDDMDVYLTHGHQAELLNSVFWRTARFLVRYVWGPLERVGVLDPTSAAKNNVRKHASEKRLQKWAEDEKHILITGHTHRPRISNADSFYFNTGSCVHPACITCIEIENRTLTLCKWVVNTHADSTMYVAREVIDSPLHLDEYNL